MSGFADIGLIGLGVMGRGLALNIAEHGYAVAVYNIDPAITARFAAQHRSLRACMNLADLVASLQPPRKLLLMITAGAPVDEQLSALRPLLARGDVIVDGGNSNYRDTVRRCQALGGAGLHFLGVGVSGGEQGARHGPALMVGGPESAYRQFASVLEAIAAKVDDNPCCAYLGTEGAGHFVKMVHNGIEYADMQLIAEVYALMLHAGVSYAQMQALFATWNDSELQSYLIAITADILAVKDRESGRMLLELILDQAEQKGTGRWAAITALELGVAAPTLIEAVCARTLSALKDERVKAHAMITPVKSKSPLNSTQLTQALRNALLAAKVCAYAQGFALMQTAGRYYAWDIKLADVASIWRGGCIIRARFLNDIHAAFARDAQLDNLLLDAHFRDLMQRCQQDLRQVVGAAAAQGVATPALSSALAYFDAYRSARLPANLTQAQRDYFGAHSYRRIDKSGVFHTDWQTELER